MFGAGVPSRCRQSVCVVCAGVGRSLYVWPYDRIDSVVVFSGVPAIGMLSVSCVCVSVYSDGSYFAMLRIHLRANCD